MLELDKLGVAGKVLPNFIHINEVFADLVANRPYGYSSAQLYEQQFDGNTSSVSIDVLKIRSIVLCVRDSMRLRFVPCLI